MSYEAVNRHFLAEHLPARARASGTLFPAATALTMFKAEPWVSEQGCTEAPAAPHGDMRRERDRTTPFEAAETWGYWLTQHALVLTFLFFHLLKQKCGREGGEKKMMTYR